MAVVTAPKDLAEQLPLAERFARWRRKHREPIEAWLILLPILIYHSIFFLFPVGADIVISFTRWTGVEGSPVWVGLDNFRTFLTPPYPITLFNTILFTFSILILQTSIAFLIAVLLNEKVIGRGVYRSLWYIPTLTSAAITAQVFFAFISPYDGVFNSVLKALGQPIVIWTMKPGWMRLFVIAYSVWRGVGTPVVLFGGPAGIHPEIHEAAMVDGADYWHSAAHHGATAPPDGDICAYHGHHRRLSDL